MRELTKEESESLFPTECHFKVVGRDVIGRQKDVGQLLVDTDLEGEAVQPG